MKEDELILVDALEDSRIVSFIDSHVEYMTTFNAIRNEYEQKINPCKIPVLGRSECRKYGIQRGGNMSVMLSMYKELLENDTNA